MGSQSDGTNKTLAWYKNVIHGQVVFIICLALLLGAICILVYNKSEELSVLGSQLQNVIKDKDVYTKRTDVAESTLASQIRINAGLGERNFKLEMDNAVYRYAKSLCIMYADADIPVTNKKISTVEKFVRSAIDVQRHFPEVGGPRRRLDTCLAVGMIESGLEQDCRGAFGELTAFQLFPKDILCLSAVARRRGFSMSSNPKDIRTSEILMYLHLCEKIKQSGSWEEGVRQFNGNWRSNPSYWLRFLECYHTLENISINEKILGGGK